MDDFEADNLGMALAHRFVLHKLLNEHFKREGASIDDAASQMAEWAEEVRRTEIPGELTETVVRIRDQTVSSLMSLRHEFLRCQAL